MSGAPDHVSEDLSGAYVQAVQGASDDAVSNQMFDALDEADASTQGQQESKVTPKLPAESATAAARDTTKGAKPRGQAPGPAFNPLTDVVSIGGDIATGLAESPKAVLGGVRNAVEELAQSIDSAGAWVAVQAAHGLGDEDRAKRIEDAQAAGEGVLSGHLPEVGAPRSVTGNLISGITQFAVGFAAGGKALKTAGLIGKEAGAAGVFLKSAFSDAFAFDPAQQRLSNLIESNPELKNPVTEFIASKPGDSEATGRLKNALEGLGVGAALQTVFTGAMQGMRAVNALKPAAPTAEQIAAHVREGLAPLGKPEGAAFSVRKALAEGEQAASDGAVSAGRNPAGNEVFINFARIEAPDDIKGLLQKTANTFSGDVKAAQRGVVSHEETRALAGDMGMEVSDLLARRKGPNGARQPFTAEEALAARRIYTASGTKLMELAQRAAGPNAGQIDLFAFRKMMGTHLAIQNEVLGARTETARALASWRIEAGAGENQMRAIQQAMETAGPDSARMAKELAVLGANGATPGAIAQYVRKSAAGTFTQGVREVFVNGLLSGPLTHIVNFTGNLGTLGLSVVERAAARSIGHATGSEAIAAGEASAMLHGMLEGQRDAFRAAWKATGDVPVDFMGKTDLPRASAIASTRQDAFGIAVNVIGATTRAPSLLMGSSDQYFKAVHYRAELHATAARTATSEGLTGKAYSARVAEVVANPPDHIKLQASDSAFYNTFNSETGFFGKFLLNARGIAYGTVPWSCADTVCASGVATPPDVSHPPYNRKWMLGLGSASTTAGASVPNTPIRSVMSRAGCVR